MTPHGKRAVGQGVRSVASLSAGTAAIRVGQLALLAIVLATTGPSEYGRFAFASAVVAIVLAVTEGGILQTATAEHRITRQVESGLMTYALAAGVLGYLVAVLVSRVLTAVASSKDLQGVDALTPILAISLLLCPAGSLSAARLQRIGKFGEIARAQVVASIIGLVAGVALTILGHGIVGLMTQSVCAQAFPQIWFCTSRYTRIRPSARLRSSKPILRAARSALTANLLGNVGRRCDDLIVGASLGAQSLGYYSAGYRVLTTATELLLNPAERVALAKSSKLTLDGEMTALRNSKRLQRRLAAIGVPAFLALAAATWLLMPLILGSDWNVAATCAALLCLAGAVQTTYWLTYSTLFAISGARLALQFQVVQTPLLLGLALLGIPFGIVYVALGYLIGSIAVGFVAYTFRSRLRSRLEKENEEAA